MTNSSASKQSSFLIVSLLLGIGAGFAPFDIHAALGGYTGLSRYYVDNTVLAMAIGGTTGLALGLVLDSKIKAPKLRARVAGWMWTALAIGVILFAAFRPSFQYVR